MMQCLPKVSYTAVALIVINLQLQFGSINCAFGETLSQKWARQGLEKELGPEVASRIFSNEFDAARQAALDHSKVNIPGFQCTVGTPEQFTFARAEPLPSAPVTWMEHYKLACNPPTQRNFLLSLANGKVTVTELPPGSSLLEAGSLLLAAQGRFLPKSFDKPCASPVIIDTDVTQNPTVEIRQNPFTHEVNKWAERWVYDACGTRVTVEMNFAYPTPEGIEWTANIAR